MYHTVIYNSNAFNVTNQDSAAVTDNWLTIFNGHYIPPQPLYFYGGWIGGANLTKATLNLPKVRAISPVSLLPIQQSLLPPDRPHFYDRRHNPFKLNELEEVSIQFNLGGTAGAQTTALLFWGTSLDPPPAGDIFSYHGTSTTAAVANAWTQIQMTWDQTLPNGTYTVVGSVHQSTNACAHRFIQRNANQNMRPGFISVTSLGNIHEPSYYSGGMGALMTFTTTTVPGIEVYCQGTDNSHDVTLNIVKTG